MTGRHWTTVAAVPLLLAVSACSATPRDANASTLASAAATASVPSPSTTVESCATCHAITLVDSSPHPDAPPLRDLYKRYPVEDLRRAFQDGVHVGHPDMPTYRLSEAEVEQILTYLEGLNPCAQPSSNRAELERCFAPL